MHRKLAHSSRDVEKSNQDFSRDRKPCRRPCCSSNAASRENSPAARHRTRRHPECAHGERLQVGSPTFASPRRHPPCAPVPALSSRSRLGVLPAGPMARTRAAAPVTSLKTPAVIVQGRPRLLRQLELGGCVVVFVPPHCDPQLAEPDRNRNRTRLARREHVDTQAAASNACLPPAETSSSRRSTAPMAPARRCKSGLRSPRRLLPWRSTLLGAFKPRANVRANVLVPERALPTSVERQRGDLSQSRQTS